LFCQAIRSQRAGSQSLTFEDGIFEQAAGRRIDIRVPVDMNGSRALTANAMISKRAENKVPWGKK
jgi:hypothetical protein